MIGNRGRGGEVFKWCKRKRSSRSNPNIKVLLLDQISVVSSLPSQCVSIPRTSFSSQRSLSTCREVRGGEVGGAYSGV